MFEYFLAHTFGCVGFGWLIPALCVLWYAAPEYIQLLELDQEALSRDKVYVPVLSNHDHIMFYGTILVPFVNIFCALLIIALEMSDHFFSWVLDLCLTSEYHRQEREADRNHVLPTPQPDKWTTPL